MKVLAFLAALAATAAAEPIGGSNTLAPPASAGGLSFLLAEGHELHESLSTHSLDVSIDHMPPGVTPPGNPHVSADAKFVEVVAGAGSQGRLSGEGIRSVLYALYDFSNVGDAQRAKRRRSDLGLYGLEAVSAAAADRREAALRVIWRKNISLDRVRIHRAGLVLVVVWTLGVPPECWEAVNANVIKRLDTTRGGIATNAGP